MEVHSKQYPEFITVTCLEWKPLLEDDRHKQVIIDSLMFLVHERRITVYAFVPMPIGMINHFHMIWQINGDYSRENVQRDFLKYTGQQILKNLRNDKSPILQELIVTAKDRKHQVWERNSLSIALWTGDVIWQKLDYIHNNPVRAGLCYYPWDYRYSSARFYLKNEMDWDFLVHVDG